MNRPLLLVSADSHASEPPGMWRDRLGAGSGSAIPHAARNGGTTGLFGDFFVAEGIPPIPLSMGNVGGFPLAERPGRLRDFDFERDAPAAGYDVAARRRAQEEDGVAAELVYASSGLRLPRMTEAELQLACQRLSNEWTADLCKASEGTLFGIASIALHDPKLAIAEMHASLARGMKGVSILSMPPLSFASSHYEPFWAAAAEAGVPVSLHALPPVETANIAQRRKPAVMENRAMALIEDYHLANILYDHAIQQSVAQIVLSGVPARHPALRFVLSEWGTAWVPQFLANLDGTYLSRKEHLALDLLPSEYFLRQFWMTFDRDLGLPAAEVNRFQDRLMWSSDFPHIESSFPESHSVFHALTEGATDPVRAKLASQNCIALYGLEGLR